MHIKLATGGIDRGRIAELCRAAKDRRWQAYRTIEHYAATGDRCRRRQLLDHFGDQSPGAPTGRCCDVHDPPNWLPPITAAKAKTRKVVTEDDGPPVSDSELQTLKDWLRHFALVRHRDGAERCVLTAISGGASPGQVADLLVSAATDRITADTGHVVDFINKSFELLQLFMESVERYKKI